ncbi:MAG: peptidoglycan bridge formation glycyltransferase FemA/FemB family protein [Caldilineaceae bacterium]|nr:peptidoglycan bridge formation glycyltransferase FemA/FemB family protein [Caldilineaceae bacterium]
MSGEDKAGSGDPFCNAGGDALWDEFVACHRYAHFLQSSAWAALKSRFGWQAMRATVGDGHALTGGASILLRRAAGITVAYVPRGPVVDWSDMAATQAVMAAVREQARQAGASVLLVEPELADSPAAQQQLIDLGLRRSPNTIQPPSTTMLELGGDEDALLARMKSKWRYNVRLAERKGVTVRALQRDELPDFYKLMVETGTRDGFGVHSAAYFEAAFDLLTPHMGAFLLAEHEGVPLGALVVVRCGQMAWYVWGASSSRERSRMPNHALQWAAMRWARAHGATRYDFWGIPDEIGKVAVGLNQGSGAGTPVDEIPLDLEALPSHDLWGVYRFKQGFGGEVVRHAGTWEMPLRPMGYRLFQVGRQLQQVMREVQKPRDTHVQPSTVNWQPVVDIATWQSTLAELPAPHVLQSWEWGAVKAQTEWQATRWALRGEGGSAVAALQFLDRQLVPFLPIRVGYVPKGPVVDWQDARAVEATLAHVETFAKRRNCIFVKIDPDVDDGSDTGTRLRHAFRQRGWVYSQEQIQFKNTALSDLSLSEEGLLEAMKSKWRYNIRLAERRGIRVREGTPADLPAFYQLYAETGARDGFLIRPFTYYKTTWESYLAAAQDAGNPAGGALLLAEHDEEDAPVAGIFILRYGARAWYFYGASSERRRRDMPNYLLQWEGMRWARAHGCTVYDWWGAPTHINDPDDGLQGVWQFKQGFGASFAPHIGAWDYATWPWAYRLYTEAMPRVMAMVRRLRHTTSGAAGQTSPA